MFKQHPGRLYTWTSPDSNTRNQRDYISIAQKWKTSLMNCRTYPGADCDTDHQLLVATLKVRLAKRQRQHSIPPLNVEELKEDKALQFAVEVTNRFTALEAAQNEVTQKISGKVPRQSCWRWPEKRLDPSSRKRKRNGYLMRLTQQSGKREKQKAKIRTDIKS